MLLWRSRRSDGSEKAQVKLGVAEVHGDGFFLAHHSKDGAGVSGRARVEALEGAFAAGKRIIEWQGRDAKGAPFDAGDANAGFHRVEDVLFALGGHEKAHEPGGADGTWGK